LDVFPAIFPTNYYSGPSRQFHFQDKALVI
jgi:hypothetical protein